MLRKSPASNVKATTLKDADVFLEFFKSYKIGRILALFLIGNSFLSPLWRKWSLLIVLNLIK